jgi:class 3 adenylate cyclase
MPNAAVEIFPGGSAAPYLADAEGIWSSVSRFLGHEAPAVGTLRTAGFRTVLFTDIVGHTEMMSRLGDDRGRAVLREHERITRELLRAHGGTEVKTMGDGFMASFGSVTKAVECAVALQRGMEKRNRGEGMDRGVVQAQHEEGRGGVPASERGSGTEGEAASRGAAPLRTDVEPIVIRVGLNAGEPIEEEGPDGRSDLFGATVILASRIAARAEGGEILVADTVRGLCSGKGFVFADRREFTAKGFEEPVRVYEVRWRE